MGEKNKKDGLNATTRQYISRGVADIRHSGSPPIRGRTGMNAHRTLEGNYGVLSIYIRGNSKVDEGRGSLGSGAPSLLLEVGMRWGVAAALL